MVIGFFSFTRAVGKPMTMQAAHTAAPAIIAAGLGLLETGLRGVGE